MSTNAKRITVMTCAVAVGCSFILVFLPRHEGFFALLYVGLTALLVVGSGILFYLERPWSLVALSLGVGVLWGTSSFSAWLCGVTHMCGRDCSEWPLLLGGLGIAVVAGAVIGAGLICVVALVVRSLLRRHDRDGASWADVVP